MEARSYPRWRREAEEEEEEERGLSGNETWVAGSWRGAGRREGGRAAVGFEEGLGAAPKGGSEDEAIRIRAALCGEGYRGRGGGSLGSGGGVGEEGATPRHKRQWLRQKAGVL
ncbi:hypothetical protein BHE74_00012637 [Ensete ventricosum]|nr:hypothetical protein GW17_00030783 [Ensete ventricosum]RWW79099.1 hypothetical protein BHE74_00012637 [Ensete ventricosum]